MAAGKLGSGSVRREKGRKKKASIVVVALGFGTKVSDSFFHSVGMLVFYPSMLIRSAALPRVSGCMRTGSFADGLETKPGCKFRFE